MKIFYTNQNCVLDDVISNFERVYTVDEADKIILTNDVMLHMVDAVKLAKSQNKKVVTFSHCYASMGMYLYPHSCIPISDKYFVWGEIDYHISALAGILNKTIITGVPIFNHIYDKEEHDEFNILFLATRNNDGDVPENKIVYDKLNEYSNETDMRIYAKLLNVNNQENYINPIVTAQDDEKHIDMCFKTLSKMDLIVTLDHSSTFVLFAMACNIPIIYVNDYGINNVVCKNLLMSGEYETSLDELYKTINEVRNNDYKINERKYWYEKCVYDSYNSVDRICDELHKL